jgi:hypothetical protein
MTEKMIETILQEYREDFNSDHDCRRNDPNDGCWCSEWQNADDFANDMLNKEFGMDKKLCVSWDDFDESGKLNPDDSDDSDDLGYREEEEEEVDEQEHIESDEDDDCEEIDGQDEPDQDDDQYQSPRKWTEIEREIDRISQTKSWNDIDKDPVDPNSATTPSADPFDSDDEDDEDDDYDGLTNQGVSTDPGSLQPMSWDDLFGNDQDDKGEPIPTEGKLLSELESLMARNERQKPGEGCVRCHKAMGSCGGKTFCGPCEMELCKK